MAEQQVLDFLRRDVLAVADDDVLGAAGDDHVALVDPAREIAGAEITFTVESRCLIFGAQITDQHLRAARADLAVIRCRSVDDALIRRHEANAGIAWQAIRRGHVPGVTGRGPAGPEPRHFGRTP